VKASFINRTSDQLASYRYRAAIPSAELGLVMNDLTADILVFAKPLPEEVAMAEEAKARGATIIVDFCDDHFASQPHYVEMALLADAITCPTAAMASVVEHATAGDWTPQPVVIPDPYEYGEDEPHCNGTRLLWFGHNSNFKSLQRVMRSLDDYELMIVSNLPFARPWSHREMESQFAQADIVVIPATAPHKSPNRAVEAIRQGCFVVAEPHPSLEGFPGIWIGDLREGIEWAQQNSQEANQRLLQAQAWVSQKFSPRTLACAWKSLFERAKSHSTSAAGTSTGPAGSTSIPSAETCNATCAS
jgi:hypothetical protein